MAFDTSSNVTERPSAMERVVEPLTSDV